jgi:trimethylamine---corrinoid protein Co-methyltransferase
MIRSSIQYQRLSQEQRQTIHEASLEILERTGVRLHLPRALEMLRKAGAQVSDGDLVRIPAGLVEKALRTVPHQIPIFDRFGEPAMVLGDGQSYYGPGSDCLYIVDHRTGERRRGLMKDVIEGARVLDALPEIDFLMSMFLPSDAEAEISDVQQMEVMLNHSSKPIIFVTNEFQGCVDVIAMAEAVAGGPENLSAKPFLGCYINVTTGLVHNEEALEKILFLAEKSIPALYIPLVNAGATSPVTLPGSMASLNAGTLVGVILSQLQRAGAPVVIPGSGLTIMDMKTTVNPYCSPDGKGITHEMGQFYNLPVFGLGGVSESKMVDQQAGAEAALTLMMETLNGAALVHDLGYLESGLSGSLAQLVICAEIVSWLKRFVAPTEVNEETLALDLIDELGPEGSFMNSEHTLAHFREHWYPSLFERNNYDRWQSAGGKSLGERASERVTSILSRDPIEYLTDDVIDLLKEIRIRAGQRGD